MKCKEAHVIFILLLALNYVQCVDNELHEYFNRTDPATRQLCEFKMEHPVCDRNVINLLVCYVVVKL